MRYVRRNRGLPKYRVPKFVGDISLNNGSFFRNNLSGRRYCNNKTKIPSGLMKIIGYIIVAIGVLLVMKNTMLYSGSGGGIVTTGGIVSGVSRGITIGTPCGVEFIIIVVGIAILLYKVNSFIGWSLISVGTLWFLISVIINFRMVFMPMNMLKVVVIFVIITFGISIIIRSLFNNRR